MAGEDPGHLALVRTLRCHVGKGCFGLIQAHHSTLKRGLSQKSHDHTVIPLCALHHSDFHDARGHFKTWTRAERAAWQAEAVELYRPKATSSDDVF